MTSSRRCRVSCHECRIGYDHEDKHKCTKKCNVCCQRKCPKEIDWKYCQDCYRYFKNSTCFSNHKQKPSTKDNPMCEDFFKCRECKRIISRKTRSPEKHHCGEIKCTNCEKWVNPSTHKCFIQPKHIPAYDPRPPKKKDDEDKRPTYVFFDLETLRRSSESSEDNKHILETNLAVVQIVCDDCKGEKRITPESYCERCKQKELVFRGPEAIEDFCNYLFDREKGGCIVFAHNLSSFDMYPILKYCYQNGILPNLIMNGCKVLSAEIVEYDVKFVDSLSFLPMPLSSLPKAFSLTELSKGYFPHLLNTPENQQYIGPLPDKYYYGFDDMKSTSDQEKFLEWYNDLRSRNYVFNFQEELLKYCRSDVDILRRSMMKFRRDFIQVTSLDPLQNSITIASACNLLFRNSYLKPNTIGIIPPNGYQPQRKYSNKAIKWLSWVASQEGIRIQHARNGGEVKIGPYFVDGHHKESKTVYR